MKKQKTKKQKIRGHVIRIDIAIILLVTAYLMFAFSNIPFIKKWRTIYIETAMTTMSHQWLATMFLPQSVIDEVMDRYYAELEKQQKLESKWKDKKEVKEKAKTEKELFFETYWELDSPSVRNYLSAHPELTKDGYDHILIEDLDKALGLKTSEGDDVCVINTANKLLIVGLSGSGYVGKLAIVKDPSLVYVAKSNRYGSWGQEVGGFCQTNNAIVGINASRFRDIGGHGSGGIVIGSMIIDGQEFGSRPKKYGMKFCGMKSDHRFYISNYDPNTVTDYQWGIEGVPALIVDGVRAIDTSMFMGLQPRSCIGQTQSGDMHMLIIEGRLPGYSLGGTIVDCMDILIRYKCYQAMNLDGGSSSIMYYKDKYITRSCSVSGRGRYLPDAFLVKKAQ
ncbi:Exopolysaccharide biosynthesis protein [Lachnospiraceae bacterium XBB1006]|nr:Exopolysaccharide biosynthesis protein [Lachnospiraceae bacterium XBB1006]